MNFTPAKLNMTPGSCRPDAMDYGLHTLVVKDREGIDIVDIVAIHGLNGHYENTWTTKRGDGTPVNWLRDLLPKKIRNARIMSFSYNSRVQLSKSASDIYVFADQLLEQLLAARNSPREKARPIVFICHSLGGIVFKQVLNKAHEKDRYSSTILSRVAGVAFFGTPHRGSGLAHWGGILSSILKACSLATSTNSQLTKDLERNSKVLENISRSFTDRGKKLKIFSFYETEKMDLMNCKVVEIESATLGWPDETCIAIDGNHRSMCWFTKEDELRFNPVWASINQMVSQARSFEWGEIFWTPGDILLSLHTSDYKAHKERNPTAVRGTCTWIFNHAKYWSWLAETDSSLLWISADAGCGKSVLASFLVDHHKHKSAGDSNICYFFFKTDSNEQQYASYGLSALLHQLYKSQPQLIQNAQNLLRERGQDLKNMATLWKLITDSTEDLQARPTICFIDGLDECEENTRKLLVNLISKYFTMPTEEKSEKKGAWKKLKLLVTSRPDNSIKNALDRQKAALEARDKDQSEKRAVRKPCFAMMRLRGEDETEVISNDIELVIKDAMEELEVRELPIDLLEDMERELISRADRTFLWVTLIIQLFRERVAEGASRRELDTILRSRSVDAIYAVLLNSNANHLKARKMLSIILAALEPLTVEELSIALAVRPDHQTFEQSKQPRRPSRRTFDHVEWELAYPFENHIKGVCGHFVRIIHQKVYLVHQTAREFLLDQASLREFDGPITTDGTGEGMMWRFDDDTTEDSPDLYLQEYFTDDANTVVEGPRSAWQHTFSLIDAHAVLLEICVTYLYLLGKRSRMPESVIGEPSPKTSAFLRYATTSWTRHFRRVCDKIPPRDLPYYQRLCHPQFPGFQRWLSASGMSITKLVGASDDELQDHLVQKLGLEPGNNGFGREAPDLDITMGNLLNNNQLRVLSSNPAASENFYFPMKADDTGFVSLDFDLARKMFGAKK